MQLYERIQSGYYNNTGTHPKKPSKSDMSLLASGKYAKAVEEWKRAMARYNAKSKELHEQFQQDLATYHGLDSNHRKTRKAFEIAWEHGHSFGYGEVASNFEDLVPLLEDI